MTHSIKKEAMQKKVATDYNYTLTIETQITVPRAVSMSINKVGAKKVIEIVRGFCLQNTLEKTSFPSSLLACPEDEEMADVVSALTYLKENWDECSKKGMKILTAKVKKAQEKIATKMSDMHKEIR